MTLEEKFEAAKERILTLQEKPSNDIMLKVYSLYKQGSQGDINMEAPGVLISLPRLNTMHGNSSKA